jgi:hypothetical protein
MLPPPPGPVRRARRWLAGHLGRLRFELAPVVGAAVYGAAVDVYAATGHDAEPAIAFGIAAGGCGAVGVYLIAKDEPEPVAAYRLGSACAALTWGSWQLASDGAVFPGVILGSVATALISIPYWRSLGARHERDTDRAERRLDREADIEIARIRALEAAYKARAQVIPRQPEAPAIETIADRGELPTVEWPGARPGLSITDPIPLSDRTAINLVGGHVLIGGGTDAGKSNLVHIVACTVITRGNARLLGIDMKPGAVELGIYRKAGARIASTKADALDLLRWVRDEGIRRGEAMGATIHDEGTLTRSWTATEAEGDEHLVLFIDELAELVDADPEAAKILKSHTRLLRAMGITIVAATQSPSRAVFGGDTDGRGQYGTRICVATFEPIQTNLILGQGAHGGGWRADLLDGRGSFLIQSRQHRDPDPDRGYWMTDPVLAGHVNNWAVEAPTHRDAEPEVFARPESAFESTGTVTGDILAYLSDRAATPKEVAEAIGHDNPGAIRARMSQLASPSQAKLVSLGDGRYKASKDGKAIAGNVVRFQRRAKA